MLFLSLFKPNNTHLNYLLDMKNSADASVTKLLSHSLTLLALVLLFCHVHHFAAQSYCETEILEARARRAEFYALYSQKGRCPSPDCRKAWGRYQTAKVEARGCMGVRIPFYRI